MFGEKRAKRDATERARGIALKRGCFDDSCDTGHCSVCGSHVMGSDWLRGKTVICSKCEVLSWEDRKYVESARGAILDRLYHNEDDMDAEAAWEEIRHAHANR